MGQDGGVTGVTATRAKAEKPAAPGIILVESHEGRRLLVGYVVRLRAQLFANRDRGRSDAVFSGRTIMPSLSRDR